nr:reverse transcriptase domain-containing protein [Tanacetum cinerariifolium]
RCVGPLQAEYVMKEIHEGSCSMHAGPWSVVAKAIRLGYFWPTMHKDAQDMIRKCSDCQIHRPITRHPQQPLTPITAPWTFYKWKIDIAGPFPEGPGKVKFLIVAMDYFMKTEAVIHAEIEMPTYRTTAVDVSNQGPCIFVHGSPHKRVATLAAADSVSSMLYPRRWEAIKTQ